MDKKCPRAILRDLNKQYSTEIKFMIDLTNEHNKDMIRWINQWIRIKILLPPQASVKAEEYMIYLMKSIGFSFKSGRMLYNCGYAQCLGRGAKWLGVKIMHDTKKDDVFKKLIYQLMIEGLLSDKDDVMRPSRNDRRYLWIVFEKRFHKPTPKSLKRWLLDV